MRERRSRPGRRLRQRKLPDRLLPEARVVLRAGRFPKNLVKLMTSGGVFPLLEREGLIAPAQ